MNQENVSEPVSAMVCMQDDDEIEPLTGKPFFNMTMNKSYLQNQLPIPTKFLGVLPEKVTVPAILTRGNKSWQITYSSYQNGQQRFTTGWNTFVEDNMLKIGDVCIFEMMSCDVTLIKFKVQILRGDFPAALLDRERENHDSPPRVIEVSDESDDEE